MTWVDTEPGLWTGMWTGIWTGYFEAETLGLGPEEVGDEPCDLQNIQKSAAYF